jgi:hypothetical protein
MTAYHTVELVKYRECTASRGYYRMNEESPFCWEDFAPGMVCMVRRRIGEATVIAEGVVDNVN